MRAGEGIIDVTRDAIYIGDGDGDNPDAYQDSYPEKEYARVIDKQKLALHEGSRDGVSR
jgi:hypothetical protein